VLVVIIVKPLKHNTNRSRLSIITKFLKCKILLSRLNSAAELKLLRDLFCIKVVVVDLVGDVNTIINDTELWPICTNDADVTQLNSAADNARSVHSSVTSQCY